MRARAEEIAVGVSDHAGAKEPDKGSVEAAEGCRRAGVAAGGFGELEHRAKRTLPARIAALRRAEEIAIGVGIFFF